MAEPEIVPPLKEALLDILRISIPQTVTLVTSLLMGVVNTAFIGHIGTENQLAGAGMANMLINVGCMVIMMGLSNGLSTLASQAYGQ